MTQQDDNRKEGAGRRIDERDLMALADGRLDPASPRAAELRAYLDAHPEDAARVAAWQRQNDAVRAHYAPAMAEALPPQLQPEALRHRHARRRQVQRRWAAASVAVMAVAVTLSVPLGSGGEADAELDRFAAEVSRLSADALPASGQEVSMDTGGAMLPSLDLAGFALTERRAIRAGGQMATEARYEDQRGQTVRLFVAEETEAGRPELHRMQSNGREIVYWREAGRMFALSTESVDSKRLQQIATATMRNELQRQQPPESTIAGMPGERQESPVIAAEALKADGRRGATAPAERPGPAGVLYDGMPADESL